MGGVGASDYDAHQPPPPTVFHRTLTPILGDLPPRLLLAGKSAQVPAHNEWGVPGGEIYGDAHRLGGLGGRGRRLGVVVRVGLMTNRK